MTKRPAMPAVQQAANQLVPTGSLRERFRAAHEMVSKGIAQAADVGGTIADVKINGTRARLELGAKFDKSGDLKAQLAELEKLETAAFDNPFVRQQYLAETAKNLAVSDTVVTGLQFKKLLYACMATTMQDGTPAAPVLVADAKGAKFFAPKMRRDNGILATVGKHAVGSSVPGVVEAFDTLAVRALQATVDDLAYYRLVDLRKEIDDMSLTIPELVITNPEREKSLRGEFEKFTLSSKEMVLVPKGYRFAEMLVKTLRENKEVMDGFWRGECDMHIVDMMKNNIEVCGAQVISGDQFLRGFDGLATIQNKRWKKSKESRETFVSHLMVERHSELGWRVVLADLPTTEALLNGKRLRFTQWSKGEVPPHIAANIRGGEDIHN